MKSEEIVGGVILLVAVVCGGGYYYINHGQAQCGEYVTIQRDLLRDVLTKGWMDKLKEDVIEQVPNPFEKKKKGDK